MADFTIHDVIEKTREVIADRGPEYRYPSGGECVYFPENQNPEEYGRAGSILPTDRCLFGEALYRLGIRSVIEGRGIDRVLDRDLGISAPEAVLEALVNTQNAQDTFMSYSAVSERLEIGLDAAGYAE